MKQNKNQKNTAVNQITEGVVWKQLLIFFFPILFGTLFQQTAEVQTTFWGRVAQMFKDFWAAITGLFGGKD